ncbi:Ig-like domain-containing protein [Streptomyces sp. NPDC051366]|uniref:Ig-like domain-containing protein n=1 Tax=Streptomyces sp. NPDC051366 TaxID=3365652 RepID=UPI0037B39655
MSKVTGPGAVTVLTGPVSLTASVTDAVGTPTGATFYVDGTAVGSATGSGPSYAVTLDITSLSDGPHPLACPVTWCAVTATRGPHGAGHPGARKCSGPENTEGPGPLSRTGALSQGE